MYYEQFSPGSGLKQRIKWEFYGRNNGITYENFRDAGILWQRIFCYLILLLSLTEIYNFLLIIHLLSIFNQLFTPVSALTENNVYLISNIAPAGHVHLDE